MTTVFSCLKNIYRNDTTRLGEVLFKLTILFDRVQAWAVKLGTEVYHFGEFITRKKEVQDVSTQIFNAVNKMVQCDPH